MCSRPAVASIPAKIGSGKAGSTPASPDPNPTARTSRPLPITSGAAAVLAPKEWWAVSPPAPWHTGIPLMEPAKRLAAPRLVARRPGWTRSALASPK